MNMANRAGNGGKPFLAQDGEPYRHAKVPSRLVWCSDYSTRPLFEAMIKAPCC